MKKIILSLIIVFTPMLLIAEEKFNKLKFQSFQEYKDFCFSIYPVLNTIRSDIDLNWIASNSSKDYTDLDLFTDYANKKSSINQLIKFEKSSSLNIKESINQSINRGLPVLAKRSKVSKEDSVWITIIGIISNSKGILLVNDSKSGPNQEISVKEISEVYSLK